MAIDIFLKIDGIEGESTDLKHAKEIDLESFTWGLQQVGNMGAGESPLALPRSKGSAKASFQDFSFVHKLDKSSPRLMENCANGAVISQAVLVIRKAGAKPVEFLKVTLSDVTVSGVSLACAAEAAAIPLETVTLRYGTIKVEYFPQKADGSLDASITTTLQTR